MAKRIIFKLDGCDISFIASAPEDITLKQLLAQCDKIKPDWCACGIRSITKNEEEMEEMEEMKVEIEIDYDSIKKVDEESNCNIVNRCKRCGELPFIYKTDDGVFIECDYCIDNLKYFGVSMSEAIESWNEQQESK